MKPILVGESNPYGGDDYYALYPAPDGCSGHRLCCRILGMHQEAYLDAFERVNLVRGKWSVRTAREQALRLSREHPHGRFILLGSKVCSAFGVEFRPFARCISDAPWGLILPHPSGLCRLWGEAGAVECARKAVAAFCPEVAPLLGQRDAPAGVGIGRMDPQQEEA